MESIHDKEVGTAGVAGGEDMAAFEEKFGALGRAFRNAEPRYAGAVCGRLIEILQERAAVDADEGDDADDDEADVTPGLPELTAGLKRHTASPPRELPRTADVALATLRTLRLAIQRAAGVREAVELLPVEFDCYADGIAVTRELGILELDDMVEMLEQTAVGLASFFGVVKDWRLVELGLAILPSGFRECEIKMIVEALREKPEEFVRALRRDLPAGAYSDSGPQATTADCTMNGPNAPDEQTDRARNADSVNDTGGKGDQAGASTDSGDFDSDVVTLVLEDYDSSAAKADVIDLVIPRARRQALRQDLGDLAAKYGAEYATMLRSQDAANENDPETSDCHPGQVGCSSENSVSRTNGEHKQEVELVGI